MGIVLGAKDLFSAGHQSRSRRRAGRSGGLNPAVDLAEGSKVQAYAQAVS
jgi:hypothetical protein